MAKTRHLFVGLTVALVSWLAVGPASALNQQSWISGTGSGANCTRALPCGDFATAVGATQAGGVISVLDSGNFGPLQLTKPVTIRADGADGGLVNLIGNFGIVIAGGPSDVFTLEGLHLDGGGIIFVSGARLHVLRCVIANVFINGSVNGILFEPNSAGRLDVTDTVLMNNGSGTTGAGILIKPQAGGSAQVALEHVSLHGNVFGVAADGTTSTAGINMTIADSMIGGNSQDGIIAVTPSGGAPIGVYVKNTKSVNNTFGIRSIGPNVTVRVDASSVIGNSTGLSLSGGGALLTFGNNAVRTNGTDGAFSGPVALQ
jgi:hypothetical protein